VRIMGAGAGILAVLVGGRKPATLQFMKNSVWRRHRALGQTIEALGSSISILIPEVEVTLEETVAKSRETYEQTGKNIVLTSEGAHILVDREPAPELDALFRELDLYRDTLNRPDFASDAGRRLEALAAMKGTLRDFIEEALRKKQHALILKAFLRARPISKKRTPSPVLRASTARQAWCNGQTKFLAGSASRQETLSM